MAIDQFAEMTGLIYGKIYSTLQAQGIPEEKLEGMTQSCFSSMAATIAHTVGSRLGDISNGRIDEMLAQVLRSSGAMRGN
ncbi:MAG: hypothetical protein Q8R07_00650 [Candidatus Uhrbacteria bacterium]|nr:hypothetical protein [Candidatus Uhrbacteria bacterium]